MKRDTFSQFSDQDLVIGFQENQNPAYFGELYNRYYQNLYNYCLAITRDREVAYDLTQDVFIKAAEKICSLRNPALFASWLFRIGHNSCIDSGKSKQRFRMVPVEDQKGLSSVEFDEEEAIAKDQLFDKMDSLLKEISPDAKEMLLAKYCENVPVRDLQEKYQLSESAVKMRLARARKRIQDQLLI